MEAGMETLCVYQVAFLRIASTGLVLEANSSLIVIPAGVYFANRTGKVIAVALIF